jgi:hypothetical protein
VRVPRVATERNKAGHEEIRLDMNVGERRFLIKMVPATDRLVTFGYQIASAPGVARCDLRIAADGQSIKVTDQAMTARGDRQNIWGKVALEPMATMAAAKRVVVRACEAQAELGSAEIAAIEAFVLRARESIALQSDAAPKPDAAAPAPLAEPVAP